jgi:hypothetical protein
VVLARVDNPQAHTLDVVASLKNGSGTIIDSLFLADDGLHGDSVSGDGLWGCQYVPGADNRLDIAVRTEDVTAGTSRTLPKAVSYTFTRGALLSVDTRSIDLRRIFNTLQRRDTTFMVGNIGYADDSIYVTLNYGNVSPDSAVAVSPTQFALAAGDSAVVTFTVRPQLLIPQYYSAVVRVNSRFGYGYTSRSKPVLFQIVVGTDVEVSEELPAEFALVQNYPNPFNPSTTIKFELPKSSVVRLSIYDVLGREVSVLVNDRRDAGDHEVQFDGSGLASGVYVYRLQADDFVSTKTMLILR